MLKAVGLRLGRLLIVLFVVSFFSFILLDMVPGDPAVRIAGFSATPEVVAEVRDELGLDDPVLVRYVDWVRDVASGDLGESYATRTPVSTLIGDAFPKTAEIALLAQVFALALALPIAFVASRRPGGVVDRSVSLGAFAIIAMPQFVLGIYLVALFAVSLGWFPVVAIDTPGFFDDPVENLRQMTLPAVTLASGLLATYVRILRTDLITTMQADHVLHAYARGFSERRIFWRHALRPASLSLVTTVGFTMGTLISGTLLVEILFAIPGLGRLFIDSILGEDTRAVQSLVLLFGVTFVVMNFLADLLSTFLDPRIRRDSH